MRKILILYVQKIRYVLSHFLETASLNGKDIVNYNSVVIIERILIGCWDDFPFWEGGEGSPTSHGDMLGTEEGDTTPPVEVVTW